MPLDKDQLKLALLEAFDKGLAEEDWDAEKAAGAMADAIDAYVRQAEVQGVEVQHTDVHGNVVAGAQTNVATLT